MEKGRSVWKSRIGFILAGVGSAVGLGNIWRFPFVAGQNGGGAFVLLYFLSVLLVGLPVLYAELMIGRKTRQNVISAFVSMRGNRSPWIIIGILGALSSFLILSYYSVVAGWVLFYLKQSIVFAFKGKTPSQIDSMFKDLVADPVSSVIWHALMIGLCMAVIWRGVDKGIEALCKFLMPFLFLCLVALDVIALRSEGAAAGVSFLLAPDFSKINASVVLQAIGQAFYSLSLGMGIMVTYGSYIPEDEEFHKSGFQIVLFGSIIAIFAGLAIFPIVFAHGMDPQGGAGLVFKTLPIVFAKMAGGGILAILFFSLLFFAALTSAISLLEVVVAYFIDRFGWDRRKVTVSVAGLVFLAGVPSALSTSSVMVGFTWLGGRSFFDGLDYLCSNWLIILGGLGLSVFVGWVIGDRFGREQFESSRAPGWLYMAWRYAIKFLAPVALTAAFLKGIAL